MVPSAAADSNYTVQQSVGFRIEDAPNFSRDPMFNQIRSGDRAPVFDILGQGINKMLTPQRDLYTNPISIPGVPVEYWGESNMADASPRTDTSTDDTDDRNQRQSSQQAEDALSQGMEALQQSLAETLANGTTGSSESSGNVTNYMGQMAMAIGKFGTLEGFLKLADRLRLQTMQQMYRILTTQQSARALLAVHDYTSKLRAMRSLWLAWPWE